MFINCLTASELFSVCSLRSNETKIGQAVQILPEGEFTLAALRQLASNGVRYAVLGIPEDIGPRANLGRGGARGAWDAFLSSFANMQSNCFLNGSQVALLGKIECDDLLQKADSGEVPDIKVMRQLCDQLDERVMPVIKLIKAAGLTPIVIGGGHNNAYPILQGTAMGLYLAENPGALVLEDDAGLEIPDPDPQISLSEAVQARLQALEKAGCAGAGGPANVLPVGASEPSPKHRTCCDGRGRPFVPIAAVNCDPHGDYRALEGRHSGNPFSYAQKALYLSNYCLCFYNEAYNSQKMLEDMHHAEVRAFSYDAVFIRREMSFEDVLSHTRQLMVQSGLEVGIELDMDGISLMPSSAMLPYGLSCREAGCFVHYMASRLPAAYLHLPEGAPTLGGPEGERLVGRALAWLVMTFIKARENSAVK